MCDICSLETKFKKKRRTNIDYNGKQKKKSLCTGWFFPSIFVFKFPVGFAKTIDKWTQIDCCNFIIFSPKVYNRLTVIIFIFCFFFSFSGFQCSSYFYWHVLKPQCQNLHTHSYTLQYCIYCVFIFPFYFRSIFHSFFILLRGFPNHSMQYTI